MCRVFAAFLQPKPFENIFFESGAAPDTFRARPQQSVMAAMVERQQRVGALATDCAKRSTKAGYDAAGIGVGVLDISAFLECLPASERVFNRADIEHWVSQARSRCLPHILVSKDGGDFLETHQRLRQALQLQDHHYVFAWTVHIRQASQGDMYSAVNAHPHIDDRSGIAPLFATMHNGDILDSDELKVLLGQHGFRFYSNADSCVIPALQRYLFDAQETGYLQGALESLAALLPAKRLPELLKLCQTLKKNGALPVTVVSALVGRIFEISNRENKYVFQTLSSHGQPKAGHLGAGTLVVVRGGFREGGEEGGEAMAYLPFPEDLPNAGDMTALVGSEENALKDQVRLIDMKEMDVAGDIREARPLIEDLSKFHENFPGLTAKTSITEGGMPIFDVNPGEVLEVRADGQVYLFDMYSGEAIFLKRFRDSWPLASPKHGRRVRQERLARLKRFQVEYRQTGSGEVMPSPLNKYGEEIIVVQPKALRDNTAKLFKQGADGLFDVVPGKRGLGMWMGTDDRADRANTIRRLDYKLVGAAGTSFLMAQIAEHMCRKLDLHRIPTMVMEGFTGSDTIPANVSQNTFFVANSNSGGTSDTIKLTRELTDTARLCRRLIDRYEKAPSTHESLTMIDRLEEAYRKLSSGEKTEIDPEILAHIRDLCPHVFCITNIEASPLGDMGRGLDERIFRPAGTGVTNLPEEECVGSTFAAMASLQWMMTLDTYLGEVRGHISHDYARRIYTSLAKLPEVCEHIVNDARLAREIKEFANRCVGGNNDFIYTGYVNGIPEEQAHKFAEMIQTMAVGWHYFMFQHGKYAHVRRASRHALGSVVGHNVPPPSWPLFNQRAKKAPREIKARAAIMFAMAHESDREELLSIPDYPVDYVFTYPADDMVLYPFQVIIISHLISYYWGLELRAISDQISGWNEVFLGVLTRLIRENNGRWTEELKRESKEAAMKVLKDLTHLYTESHRFDNAEVRRMNAIFRDLYLLSNGYSPDRHVTIEALLGSPKVSLDLKGSLKGSRELSDEERLTILKDLTLEISTATQAKRIADLFLTDENGRVIDRKVSVKEISGRSRAMNEYDYWCQYEGLGEFYHVNPIHPPKIAKAKKGWL